jgi:cysteinyl-tRNA synthetase, unknown class
MSCVVNNHEQGCVPELADGLGTRLSLALLVSLCCWRASSAEPFPRSFAYVLQAESLARTKAGAVAQLAACGRDWLVVDARFSSEAPWTRSDLDAMREKHAGRKVIAYLSIGEAEEYRPYWQAAWGGKGSLTPLAPSWLEGENPEWKGNYRVKYWRADWRQIILAAVDEVIGQGFDGLYLDIVDGFESFEHVGKDWIDDRVNPDTRQSFRRDMVDWVKAIAARARARNPAALIIPQNGSQLLAHRDFVDAISGIGLEDLFTNGDKLQPKSHTSLVLGCLKRLEAAPKPVLLIEYPKKAERRDLSKRLAAENGFAWLVTDRQLKTLGESGR